ncbi:30S ribosomal protein S14 [Roseospirillum parvum]|uniref:Small ribosomal subunit protein uS14 n=1 Tax=Roseospirillum parvum TaxID=83401 RepID=A0A1G8BHR6_9PROT|nr:30S ribosomal protein S14 [Roseospirillum parvum]SDH32718.1 small subunit ribosomal protein S14 [Roseospirillum parvum]
MAKKSAVEKNKNRARLVANQANRRAALKAMVMDREASPEERFEATLKLAEMPRNGAKVRLRNRCQITGRPRGTYRKFKLARVKLRDMASEGQIPGMVKSSW